MNDFTKEELKQLLQWRNSILYIAKPSDEIISSNIKLGDKIQSMIDNCCENESSIVSDEERERKFKIYREQILPAYDNNPDKVPPHLEPDFNEGWK